MPRITRIGAASLVLCSSLLAGCGGGQGGSGSASAEAAVAGAPAITEGTAKNIQASQAVQARVFAHPGAPLTRSDLETLKSYVDQGRQPWKSAFDLLSKDGKAQLTTACKARSPR